MDRIRMLYEGQSREARRRIQAAYYLGAADGLKVSRETSKADIPLLRHQAE